MVEALVGAVLLTSGLVAPVDAFWQDPEPELSLEGRLLTPELMYSGEAHIGAPDAAFREEGAFQMAMAFEEVDVEVYSYQMTTITNAALGYRVTQGFKSMDTEVFEYENATIEVQGDEDGHAFVFPSHGGQGTSFLLNITTPKERLLTPSAKGAVFATPDAEYSYNIPGPTLGLGNGTDRYGPAPLSVATFQEASIGAGTTLVVSNGTMAVQHSAGHDEHTLYEDEGIESHTVGSPSTAEAGFNLEAHGAYAVIEFPEDSDVQAFTGIDGDGVFFSQSPVLPVNGTVLLEGTEGTLAAGDEEWRLEEDQVGIEGDIELTLTVVGQDDESQDAPTGWGLPPLLLDEPQFATEIQGSAERVKVNGEEVASPPPELREEVTLIGQILGALLLVWSIGRRVLSFFAVGLLARDPLDHERRQRIHDLLEDKGMSYLREIQRVTEIPLGSVAYHLRVLKAAGLVTSVKKGGYRVYFLASSELPNEEMERLALLANGTRKEIAQVIARSDGVSQEELANQVGKSQNWLSRLLSEFEEAGLVDREGDWRSVYRPSPLLERWFS